MTLPEASRAGAITRHPGTMQFCVHAGTYLACLLRGPFLPLERRFPWKDAKKTKRRPRLRKPGRQRKSYASAS